jgi:hypothetical protein
MREAAQWARNEQTTVVGNDASVISAVFSTSAEQIHAYDPRAIILQSTEQLNALANQARTENRTLAVYFCNRSPGKKADLCRALRLELAESGNYNLEKTLPGMEPMWNYEIYLLNNLHQTGTKLQQK